MYEDEYLESDVMTASGPRLHMLVVDGALQFASFARDDLQNRNFEGSHENLNRSRECVSELISGLNPEVAPEMVGSLKQLFAIIYRHLAMADITHETAEIDQAIKLLTSHRDAWAELLIKLPAEKPGPEGTSPTEWEV